MVSVRSEIGTCLQPVECLALGLYAVAEQGDQGVPPPAVQGSAEHRTRSRDRGVRRNWTDDRACAGQCSLSIERQRSFRADPDLIPLGQ